MRLRSLWWRVKRWLRHPARSFRSWWYRGRYDERRSFAVHLRNGETFTAPENFIVTQWAANGERATLRVGNVVWIESVFATPPGTFLDLYTPLLVARGQTIEVGGSDDAGLALAGVIVSPSRRELRRRRRSERRKEAA